MKTLYLSDLDGTLLRSDEKISAYTASVINQFVRGGGCFSYATARSLVTASKVTAGLETNFPVICYNGAFVFKNNTNEILLSNYFSREEIAAARSIFISRQIYPVVYAYINEKEHFSYDKQHVTPAMRFFLDSRKGDPRCRAVTAADELYAGDVFYFACMDTARTLSPINDFFKTRSQYNSLYQKDIYSGAQWCELLPVKAAKANAALQIKKMLNCDKMVVFGDAINDMSLFEIADEKYATANAVPELKKMATAVIDSNDNDGVAKWIEKNA